MLLSAKEGVVSETPRGKACLQRRGKQCSFRGCLCRLIRNLVLADDAAAREVVLARSAACQARQNRLMEDLVAGRRPVLHLDLERHDFVGCPFAAKDAQQ